MVICTFKTMVAFLYDKDSKELLVEDFKEEHGVRATVPSGTSIRLLLLKAKRRES